MKPFYFYFLKTKNSKKYKEEVFICIKNKKITTQNTITKIKMEKFSVFWKLLHPFQCGGRNGASSSSSSIIRHKKY
ncbi:hypothetical protein LguiA_027912 [Lonicera macranthoides]